MTPRLRVGLVNSPGYAKSENRWNESSGITMEISAACCSSRPLLP